MINSRLLSAATPAPTLASVDAAATDASAGADLLWTLIGGVLVFFMQAGFALLEAGSVRQKNYQNILLKNLMDACIGGLVWWAIGFGLAYGSPKDNGFIGTKYFFGVGLAEDGQYAAWFFQWAFAATAATIVSGSLAERVNINCYLFFSFLMTGFIYPVVVAWTWGQGYLTTLGFTDFAGSGIVHLTGGVAGFVGAAICGARLGKFKPIRGEDIPDYDKKATGAGEQGYSVVTKKFYDGQWDMLRVNQFVRNYATVLSESDTEAAHSPQQVALGTLILWLGWLLFNGASSAGVVGDNGKAASIAIVNTIICPSAAGIATFILKPKIVGGK